jgi:hypothetical protein
MKDTLATDLGSVVDEAIRYLAAVDAFRALNCEPSWRPESAPIASSTPIEPRDVRVEKSAH